MKAATVSTRAASGKPRRTFALTFLLLIPGIAFLLVFFVYPFLLTIDTSFRTQSGSGYTLAHYQLVFGSAQYWRVILLTLELAAATTLCSILLAVPLALILRQHGRGHRFLRVLILVPLMTLALVSALGMLIVYGPTGWLNLFLTQVLRIGAPLRIDYTIPGLILFYTWLYSPYTILTTMSAMEGIDAAVEEAARVAGASPFKVFRLITLPLSLSGIRAGSLLTFLLAFGAFNIPLIAGGNHRPLAVTIYTEAATFNHWEVGSALATVMAAITLAATLLYQKLLSRGGET